ncbi:MAG TPA: protein kinase [Ktedonosporobacter sp.]|nr:protein kinase [Ktedonosporobacter sp.]
MYSTDEQIGSYRVISRLSYNGTSSRYVARSLEDTAKQPVTICVWEHVQLIEQSEREPFLIEARSLVELRHPNILPLIDYGFEQDKPYVVMEHADPPLETLPERLKHGLFSQGQALLALTQISTALAYAHARGVVHGRLAPEYVYLNASNQAFLAFPLTTLPKTVVVEYAEAYRAPEQNLGGITKSKLSDQYTLACVGHTLFTGQPPLSAQSLDSTLPAYAREALSKALAQPPLGRFASVEQFLQVLPTPSEEDRTETRTQVFSQEPAPDHVMPFLPRIGGPGEPPTSPPVSSSMAYRFGSLLGRGRAAFARSRQVRLVSGLLLLLLLPGIAIPLIIKYAPASAATVTITPLSKHLKNGYLIAAVPKNPDPANHQISLRHLGFTARVTKTVHATGKGHQDAISAKGTIILSNPSENVFFGADATSNTTNSFTATAGGLTVASDVAQYTPINVGGSASLPVHIEQAGANGNVSAHYFDGTYIFHQFKDNVDTGHTYTATLSNPDPFSGGQDAQDFTYLQQQDIDSVVNPLMDSLTTSAKAEVQKQILPNEKAVAADLPGGNVTDNIFCSNPDVGGNKVNDHVIDAPLTIAVTCQTDVYDPQQARDMAISWLKDDATQQLGASYQLADNVVVTTGSVVSVSGNIMITVATEGIWVYQFSQEQRHQIAQSITGKAQDDALVILDSQQGVVKATLSTSGGFLGTALPWSAENIQITLVNVKGLQTS